MERAKWVPFIPDARTSIIGKVQEGRWKPDRAESVAARLGLGPLRPEPDMSRFDPMSRATWTLPMVIAWICWRTPEQVRQCWNEFRRECWDWQYYRSRLPIDGGREWEEVSGWELKQREEITLLWLSLMETSDEVTSEETSKVVSVKTAREQLWEELAAGRITATALKESDGGRPAQIPSHEWPYLSHAGSRDLTDELHFASASLRAEYRNVTFQRFDVVRLWPAQPDQSSGSETQVVPLHQETWNQCVEWLAARVNEWRAGEREQMSRSGVEQALLNEFGVRSPIARKVWAETAPSEWRVRGRRRKAN